MKNHRGLFVLASIVSILAYSCSLQEKNVGTHPDFKRLPQNDEISYRTDILKTDYKESLGLLPSPDELIKGNIIGDDTLLQNDYHGILPSKFQFDDRNNIYIQQWTTNSINVYSQQGEYLYSIGGSGLGPGEFRYIRSFDFNENFRTLYVLDLFKVDVFSLKEGKFVYKTTFDHELFSPETICVLDSSIYISGFRKDSKKIEGINKYDLENYSFKKSFGYGYISYQDIFQHGRTLSQMLITCNNKSETIIGQLKEFPFVFGYSPDGSQKWVSKIDSYISPEFPETSEPSLLIRANTEIYNRFYPFINSELNEFEVIQIGYFFPAEYLYDIMTGKNPAKPALNGREEMIHTIIIDTYSGKLFNSKRFDLIGAINDGTVILLDQGPEVPKSYQNTFYLNEF